MTSLLIIISEFSYPFDKMKTEYLRFQTPEEMRVHFVIRSEEIFIDYWLDDKLVNGKGVDVESKAVTLCLVPLRNVLKYNLGAF